MSTDERLTNLEKQVTGGRRFSLCLLVALCLSFTPSALVAGMMPSQPATQTRAVPWREPDDMIRIPKDRIFEGAFFAIIAIVILIILIRAGTGPHSETAEPPRDSDGPTHRPSARRGLPVDGFLTTPCRHCGKPALREPGAYGYYAECAECGKTTYTGP